MRRLLTGACGGNGIDSGDWAFCKVGQSYMKNVVPAVEELSSRKKRVLIVELYLASSAKTIHDIGTKMGRDRAAMENPRGESSKTANPFESLDVRFSEKGIAEHPEAASWVLECAREAIR